MGTAELLQQLAEARADAGKRSDLSEKRKQDLRAHGAWRLDLGASSVPLLYHAGYAGFRARFRGTASIMAASMTEPLDIRRKRLLFRSWHRGTKEADLLLGSFAERHLAGFSPAQVDRYESLLGAEDADLLAWIGGRAVPPAERESDVLRLLLAFKYAPRPA